jgi:hypothetical protein
MASKWRMHESYISEEHLAYANEHPDDMEGIGALRR